MAIAHYPVQMPIAQTDEPLGGSVAVVGKSRLAEDRILKCDGKGGVCATQAVAGLGVHVLRLQECVQRPVRLPGEKLDPALKTLLPGKKTFFGKVGGNVCFGRKLIKCHAFHDRCSSLQSCKKPSVGRDRKSVV